MYATRCELSNAKRFGKLLEKRRVDLTGKSELITKKFSLVIDSLFFTCVNYDFATTAICKKKCQFTSHVIRMIQ